MRRSFVSRAASALALTAARLASSAVLGRGFRLGEPWRRRSTARSGLAPECRHLPAARRAASIGDPWRRSALAADASATSDRDRTRLEERRMGDVDRAHVVAHHDHAHAHLGQVEELLGEPVRQADAAVRCRLARQHAGVQRDAGPGDALHEGHRGIVVEIGVVLPVLLDDAVDAGRRLVAGLAGRDRRPQDLALGVVDGDPLVVERDDGQQRHAGRAGGLSEVVPVCLPAAPGARRVGDAAASRAASAVSAETATGRFRGCIVWP